LSTNLIASSARTKTSGLYSILPSLRTRPAREAASSSGTPSLISLLNKSADCNGDRTPRFAKNSLYKSFCILSLSIFSGVDMYGEKPSGVFDGDGDAKDGESPPPASFFFTSPFFTNNDITSISLFVDCSNPPVVFILFWKISSADSLIKSWMLLFL